MSQKQFSFPVLKNPEILQCMRELEIPLTEEQLTHPTPEVVRTAFEALAGMLVAEPQEEQLEFAGIDAIERPELHEDSVPAVVFHRNLCKLMQAAYIHDFHLGDIIHPEYKRTKKICSGIINFVKFREEKLVMYQELTQETDTLIETRQQLEETHETVSKELQKYNQQKEEEAPIVEQLEKEIAELEDEISDLNKTQAGQQTTIRQLKNDINELGDKIATDKFNLLNSHQEIEKMECHVVSSPERVKKDLQEMQNTIEQERALMAESEQSTRGLLERVSLMDKCLKDVGKCVEKMGECESERLKQKEVSASIKTNAVKVQDMKENIEVLETKEEHINRQILAANERLKRMQDQNSLKQDTAQEQLESLTEERLMVEREKAAQQKKIEQNEMSMRRIRENNASLEGSHNAEMQEMLVIYEGLENQVREYHRELEQAMEFS